MRVHAGHQPGGGKRLGDVVVRAGFEARDRIGIRIRSGQNHDRAGHARVAKRAAQHASVAVGQGHVEHHEFVKSLQALLEAFGIGWGFDSFIDPAGGQLLGQGDAQHLVVVHEKNALCTSHTLLLSPYPWIMRETLSRFLSPVYVQAMTAKKTGKRAPRRAQNKPRTAPLLPPEHLVERAAGELRRGAPVFIRSAKRGESAIAVAAETAFDTTLAALVKLCGTT